MEPVSSLLQGAQCTHSGHRVSMSSCIFDNLLFDGNWTPCTLLRAAAWQHSKLQTGPSSGIRTPPGPGRGRHRHADCGPGTRASDINNFTRQSRFFCNLTFLGELWEIYISHDPCCSQLSNSSNDTFHKYLLCWWNP